MKKLILLTLSLSFIASNSLQAQSNNLFDHFSIIREFNAYKASMGKSLDERNMHYDQIEGSPYLNHEFTEGELITKDRVKLVNVKLRYNIYNDDIEYQLDGEIKSLANPTDFNYFVIGEAVFIYQPISLNNPQSRKGFFQLLSLGNATVLKRMNVIYNPPAPSQGYEKAKPAMFIRRQDNYLIWFNFNIPVEVSLNRKKILNAFPDKRNELEKFINENQLSFKKEEDLIKLAEFYNKL